MNTKAKTTVAQDTELGLVAESMKFCSYAIENEIDAKSIDSNLLYSVATKLEQDLALVLRVAAQLEVKERA